MSEQFHGAPTAAEWAICRGREMRIQNFNMQPVFNVQSFATGKRRFGPKVPRFHLLDVASTNLDIRSTRDETEHTLIWLTNGPSLKATQPSVSLAQGQCFAYCCRKSWKLVAGPCLRNFMEKRQLQNELLDVALLFSRAKIILFSTEVSSFDEVRQLLSEGPKLKSWQHPRNDDSFRNNPRLEIQNWNPFANARKRAQRGSQVSSGRPSIGQKHVWLTDVAPHLKLHHRRQIHQKQKWSMEFCCKPLVQYSQRASGNRGKFAWTAQVYDFGWCGVSGQSKYHWLAATGISGLSTDGSIIKIQDSK